MDQKILQQIKEKLEKNKELLEKELQTFATADDTLKGDWDSKFPDFNNGGNLEEAADEVEEYTTRLPIEHSLEIRLRDISLALEKIKNGTYGKCEKCGKDIPADRMEIYPEARFCVVCN